MNETLFRGKRADTKEWVDGMLAYFFDKKQNAMIMPSCYFGTRDFGDEDEKGNPIIDDKIALGGFINVIPETVGQYTTLDDCHGKKIFKGDRIKTLEVYNNRTEEHIYEVIWEDHGWVIKCETKENNDSWLCFLSKNNIVPLVEWKVIGNIYDNPQII